jgi:hypothetical protein
MADYSLVPVDYKPNFENYSLVPVDYNLFSNSDGIIQQAPTQLAQTKIRPAQVQFAQSQPQSPQQQPATGSDQPSVNGPAGNGPAGSSGGNAGSDPSSPASDQAAVEPPFSGLANPTPTESLVNQAKMAEQRKIVEADRSGKHGFAYDEEANAEEPSTFVTTRESLVRYLIEGGAGQVFTEISPFYVKQGSRHAIIDASPERPVTVTIHEGGKFTISRP